MKTTYKVWICVEKCNDETDEYKDIDLTFSVTAEFKSEKKAANFAEKLHRVGEVIQEGK